MNRIQALVAVVLCWFCVSASAQWAWRDANGNRVFSDVPPPPSVPNSSILKEPGGGNRTVVRDPDQPATADALKPAMPAVPPALAASATGVLGQDKALEARKKQAEEAEAAKQKAAADKLAKARADNCVRARQAKGNLESGVRVARTNAQGEREFLDDAAKASEIKRLQGIIASDCK